MDTIKKEAVEYFAGRFGKDALDLAPTVSRDRSAEPQVVYKSELCKDDLSFPEITCLCPTYGRFEWLKNCIACFLLQDYPNKRLIICNDHAVKLNDNFLPANVEIVNCPKRFPTLGDKRQFMLEYAKTDIVAHWDDDDLYMPWHLLWTIKHMKRHPGTKMIRLHPALFVEIELDKVVVKEECNWEHEAMSVFERKTAISIGGYDRKNLQEAVALQERFISHSFFTRINVPSWMYSFLYNRFDKTRHLCQAGDGNSESYVRCGSRNADHGNFKLLVDSPDPERWARQRMCKLVFSYLQEVGRKWGEVAVRHLREKFQFDISV